VSRRLHLALWTAVLALGLALRAPALVAGLPYLSYADEGYVLHPAVRLLRTGSWDPGDYSYPSLPMYAIAGALSLYSPVYRAVHGHALREDLSDWPPRQYGIVEPVEVVVAGRLLTLCASLGIVVLAGLLARRLGGNLAGLCAALLAAAVPALVIRSAVTTVDPWATFFVLAALFFAEIEAPLLAGVMTGCAATSKYTAALAGLAVAATLLRVPRDWRRKARAVELAALAALLTVVATMPALALRGRAVVEALAGHAVGYDASNMGSYWDQAVRRAELDLPFERPELGWPFLACAVLGWLAALLDRRDHRLAGTAAAWTLYAGAVLALFGSYEAQPFRNLLPLVPLACVLAALFFARRPWIGAAAVALILVLFLPPTARYALERARTVDSRVEAVDWLLRHRRPEETVLVSEELAILRAELARMPGRVVVMRQPRAISRLVHRRDVRFVLTGNFGRRGRNLGDVLLLGKTRAPYRRVAAFGGTPGTGRTDNGRRVVIYCQRRQQAVR
jgi:hypothetical protein